MGIKLCRDCAYRVAGSSASFDKCENPATASNYADISRRNECGERAKLFTQKRSLAYRINLALRVIFTPSSAIEIIERDDAKTESHYQVGSWID